MASVTGEAEALSCRLFCTTTLAWRWTALTVTALAIGSSIGTATRRMASRCRRGSDSQAATHSARTRAPSGSSVTPSTAGPMRASRVSVRPAIWSAKPRSTPSMSLRWSRRNLHDQGVARRERRGAAQDCRRPAARVALEQADLRQEGQDPLRAHRTVLGGQRVDGRLDDPDVGTGQPGRHERRVGEEEGPALGQVGLQEVPRLLGEGVGVVRSDVAPPGGAHAVRNEVVGHAGRLGVVQEDDVVAVDPGRREPPRWPRERPCSARPRAVRGARCRRARRGAGCAGAS